MLGTPARPRGVWRPGAARRGPEIRGLTVGIDHVRTSDSLKMVAVSSIEELDTVQGLCTYKHLSALYLPLVAHTCSVPFSRKRQR